MARWDSDQDFLTSSGAQTVTGTGVTELTVTDTTTVAAIKLNNSAGGKFIRVNSANLEVLNNAGSVLLFTVGDAGGVISRLGVLQATAGPIIGFMSTDAFSGAITITVDSTKGNVHKIAATSNTASTLTPSGAGTAGQHMWIILTADGTGGNVITFASTFKPTGTMTLTANKGHTIHFISDGANWWEVARTLAL